MKALSKRTLRFTRKPQPRVLELSTGKHGGAGVDRRDQRRLCFESAFTLPRTSPPFTTSHAQPGRHTMHTELTVPSSPARHASTASRLRRPQWLRLTVLAASLASAAASHAIDFGPFTLTGFAKADLTRVTPYCPASALPFGR